jgi:hypothetical protein
MAFKRLFKFNKFHRNYPIFAYIFGFCTGLGSFWCLKHPNRPHISGDIKYFGFEVKMQPVDLVCLTLHKINTTIFYILGCSGVLQLVIRFSPLASLTTKEIHMESWMHRNTD